MNLHTAHQAHEHNLSRYYRAPNMGAGEASRLPFSLTPAVHNAEDKLAKVTSGPKWKIGAQHQLDQLLDAATFTGAVPAEWPTLCSIFFHKGQAQIALNKAGA